MTDFAAARRNMVDGQIRTADVTDLRLLWAFQETLRERFVPPQSAALAYVDFDLPVAPGRCLMKPRVLAKMLQAAGVAPADRVLIAGCATGYGAAVLARVAAQVVALEENADLARAARAALAGVANAEVVSGPLTSGWAAAAPYDLIVMEGATEVVPEALLGQLSDGGRLACVLGGDQAAKAMVYLRTGNDVGGRAVFDAAAPVLPGFVKPPAFAF
ncbi:MAG TPA: protein-L-isoaspartate O-methyltransferase [Pseudolabrys sp.]|nr:protein-L-isoaspartate O-methyltransferase [Pseudolabrys sp.]